MQCQRRWPSSQGVLARSQPPSCCTAWRPASTCGLKDQVEGKESCAKFDNLNFFLVDTVVPYEAELASKINWNLNWKRKSPARHDR